MMAAHLADRVKSIRAVLFDKDGTLIDFDRTWFSISWQLAQWSAQGDEVLARALLDAGGYDWLAERFRANSVIAAGTVEDIVSLWHPGLAGPQLRALIEKYDAYCIAEGARSAIAIEAVHETLAALRGAGYRLGIATNDSEAGARVTAKALGIDHLFDVMIGYDTAARPKPFPDPLLYFAGKLGLSPHEIAMVGDNLHDLETAHAAGAGLAVGVLSGNSPREALEPHADLVLESVAGLPAILQPFVLPSA
ncbi:MULTISPECIES: HAD family hydrolase [unclassified Brucella]|uniref:HAD family hydrolase n=1 Tax=unclassified Brucella TaxID=2632610 RepID=UPI0012AE6E96|nr:MULTISPECIES: HAD family hydrolase [unclassified Brucella]MRN42813.1 HAD-IA family hydrolase [Brucella sp. 09RB8913]MRN58005.1 HAD-IA family hydrolase [Brucella sp. 09RB8918]CAB4327510.1 hydrolase, haloacid dehalogenase-like family [Brucella sp. 191011898]